VCNDFKQIMELQVFSDKMPVRHHFEAPIEVEITEREECVNQTTSPGALVYYTDGWLEKELSGRNGNLWSIHKVL
jgi:hypothetical protein